MVFQPSLHTVLREGKPLPDPTGLEQGKRIIVCGMSPHVLELNKRPDIIKPGDVLLGLNYWACYYPCDYWIACDTTALIKDTRLNPIQQAADKGAIRFLNKAETATEHMAEYWFEAQYQGDDFSTEWTGKLAFCYTTAVAAINLAVIMQPSEILLYGVDFVGEKRFDTQYSWCWAQAADKVNVWLRRFAEVVPICKLHPGSPLDVPLMKGY